MNPQTIEVMALLEEYGTLAGEPEAIHRLASLILAKITEIEKEAVPENAILVGSGTMGRSLAEAVSLLSVSSGHVFKCAWCESSPDGSSVWSDEATFAKRVEGKIVFIIDDVLPATDTIGKTIELVKSCNATVGGVVKVVDRNPNTTAETMGVPWLISFIKAKMRSTQRPSSLRSVERVMAMGG